MWKYEGGVQSNGIRKNPQLDQTEWRHEHLNPVVKKQIIQKKELVYQN